MKPTYNPYSILGVSEDASQHEIETSYQLASQRFSSQVNPDSPGAALQFQEINEAYTLLSDPSRRRAYDDDLRRSRRTSDNLEFSLRVTPSKRTVTNLPEVQVIYLLVEILPGGHSEVRQTRDSRLNLSLVLDRSNSMKGTRLDKVKVATHQIIDQLSEQDVMSVVAFNDRAEVIIAATPVSNKAQLKARSSMIRASGGTEIFQGLSAGMEQIRKHLDPHMVNHIIMLTDGNSYGDQDFCLELAHEANQHGIGISAMGLGQDWNDEFLDELASITGSSSSYINSASAVTRFLHERVRSLANVFAERVRLSFAPDPGMRLESAFQLSPNPQPLKVADGFIQLGGLQLKRPISLLLQVQLPSAMEIGFRPIARLLATGDILTNTPQNFEIMTDISLEISDNPVPEEPPVAILDALGKLTLYNMQERAQAELDAGNVQEATKRLEQLATRLLAVGEEELADEALAEARRVAHTANLSDKGRKELKYQTRMLLLDSASEDAAE